MSNHPFIKYVTFTGADNDVDPKALRALWDDYEKVEFGILINEGHMGKPRYPTFEWIERFAEMAAVAGGMDCAAHFCGDSFLDLCRNPGTYKKLIAETFQRVQLNFNWSRLECRFHGRVDYLLRGFPRTQFIIQCNDSNAGAVSWLNEHPNLSLLFDESGGRGKRLKSLPRPVPGFFCGYAGGIGPDNIDLVLAQLGGVCEGGRTWIDMESSLRDDSNEFSIEKCRDVIEAVGNFWDE